MVAPLLKFFTTLMLLIACASAIRQNTNSGTTGNNYQFGAIGTSAIINSGTVSRPLRLGQIVTQDYVYTAPDPVNSPDIVAIVITDQMRRKGATAAIVSGGVGSKSVTIRFTSRRGAGINSRVDIYG